MTTTRSLPTWRKSTELNSLYDAGARAYERHAETSVFNARYERPAMLNAIGDVGGLRILDAGCAAGAYCATFASSAREIVAVDASAPMIALVESKHLSNVVARVHDLAQPLGWLADASVDLVFSSLTMHYVASWDLTLSEFRRVLVPGGRLVFSTHHPAMTAPLVEHYFETQPVTDTWVIGGIDTDVSFFHRSMESIVNAVIDAGFALERIREPRLEPRAGATDVERRLATHPWFLILEARKPRA